MYENIDFERLRSDLMDYYGAAMMYYPVAVIELTNVETASNDKLIQIAMQNGFDLSNYEKQNRR